MEQLSLHNPLFATYVIAVTLMILEAVSMSWLTVLRMLQVKGGIRSPEDLKKTPLNPAPNPHQLEPNESVDRIRRILPPITPDRFTKYVPPPGAWARSSSSS